MGNAKSAKSYQFSQKGKPEVFCGTDGAFQFPMAVAGGPHKGHVFVTDNVHNNVQVYDVNKEPPQCIKTFGSKGDGEGQFSHPTGIAVNSSGEIIVADTSNNRIQIFNSYCEFKKQFGTAGHENGQFINPFGVACDSHDNIYVSDNYNGAIQVFDSTGRYLRHIGKAAPDHGLVYTPSYLAVHDDRLYVSDNAEGCVKVYNATKGDFISSFSACQKGKSQMKNPTGITVDPKSGLVFVGDSGNNRIDVFQPDGTFVVWYGSKGTEYGQFTGIGGLAVPWEGCFVVCDLGSKRVEVFSF